MQKRQRSEFNESELFAFARSYLSEAFPNPERIDCPADSDLQRMAEHPVAERDAYTSNHLTCCSPCFTRYMEILAGLKRRNTGPPDALPSR